MGRARKVYFSTSNAEPISVNLANRLPANTMALVTFGEDETGDAFLI